MPKAIIDEQNLQDIADAIRSKNGSQDTYKPAQMAGAISAIPQGGDLDGIVDGTITAFEMPAGMTTIAPYRFYNMTALQTADLGNCTTVGDYAFDGCTGVTFPNNSIPSTITSVGNAAFRYAGALGTSFNFSPSQLCNLAMNAFQYSKLSSLSGQFGTFGANCCVGCSELTSVEATSMGEVGIGAFKDCTHITTLRIPVVGRVNNDAFNGLNLVSTLDLSGSAINYLGDRAFRAIGKNRENPSQNILNIDLSNASFSTIYSDTFSGGSSVDKNKYLKIKLPSTVTTIQSGAFQYSDNVDVYFTSTAVPSLSNTSAFDNFTGNVFIPYNIVHAWSSATNWTSSSVKALLKGYSAPNTFAVGDTLPAINVEGYALTWYSDKALTTQVTTVSDASAVYYCSFGDTQVGYGITIAYADGCTLSLTDGVNTYRQGEGVPTNTVLTITATPTTPGWTPYSFTVNGNNFTSGDTVTVTGDLDIIALYWDGVNVPINPILGANSPSVIASVCKAGNAKQYWSIGDTVDITLTNSEVVTYRLSDATSNRYEYADGTGYSQVVFEPVNQLSNRRGYMNATATNSGGWASSYMRNTTMATIYDLFPQDWKSVISQVKVLSGTGGGTTSGTSSSDNYLFLMAECEIMARANSVGSEESPSGMFEYYQTNIADSYRIKKRDGTATSYWLRSPRTGNAMNFVYINGSGNSTYWSAVNNNGIAPCFAL